MNGIKEVIKKFYGRERTDIKPAMTPDKNIKLLEQKYGQKLPEEVVELYSTMESGFLQINEFDTWRVLSIKEILNASQELNINFIEIKKLPLIDCMVNNYICFDFQTHKYIFMNIEDMSIFSESNLLINLLQK